MTIAMPAVYPSVPSPTTPHASDNEDTTAEPQEPKRPWGKRRRSHTGFARIGPSGSKALRSAMVGALLLLGTVHCFSSPDHPASSRVATSTQPQASSDATQSNTTAPKPATASSPPSTTTVDAPPTTAPPSAPPPPPSDPATTAVAAPSTIAPPSDSTPSQAASASSIPPASGLEYIEVVTGNAPASDRPLPLVISVHGLGSNPRRFAMLVRNYPGRARFVLPRAPDPYGPQGYSWFPLTRPLHRPPKATLNHMLKSADRLAALIRELQADHPNTPKPIIMGFSQGGLMSYAVATRHPQLIRAALPISGWLPDAMVPTQAPNFTPLIWSMHGTSDTVVPELPTRTMVDTLKALHFQVEYTSWPNVGHTISQDMRHALFEQLDTLLAQESPP